MSSNVFKCLRIFSTIFRSCQTSSNVLKGLKRFETVFKRSQKHLNAFMAPRTTQTYPNAHTSHQNCFKMHPIRIQQIVSRLKWIPTCPYTAFVHLPFPILYVLCVFGHVRSCAARTGTARNSMKKPLNFGRTFRRTTRHWQSSLQSPRNPWRSRWQQMI